MSKRLTDTDKWKKNFIKGLPVEYKLFWLYLLDEVDHAGIWHIEMDMAELRLGTKLSKEKAQGLFSEKVVVFDNGNKWFLPDFIKFQYGELNEKSKVHAAVFKILKKYNLLAHLKSIHTVSDTVKDKEKDKVIIGNEYIEAGEKFFLSPVRPTHAPSPPQVIECFFRMGKPIDAAASFFNYYEGLGWMKGITPITAWTAFANRWEVKENKPTMVTKKGMVH